MTDETIAYRMWASTPPEHRYFGNVGGGSLSDSDIGKAARRMKQTSEDVRVSAISLATRVYATPEDAGDNVMFKHDGIDKPLNVEAFRQLCERAGRRGGSRYLTGIPAERAVKNLKEDMRSASEDGTWDIEATSKDPSVIDAAARGRGDVQVLLRENEVAAVNGRKYKRLWNADLVEMLEGASSNGWKTPPARPAFADVRTRVATEADLVDPAYLGGMLSIKPGDPIAPGGAYLDPQGMFLLLAHPDRGVMGPNGRPLMRAAIVRNSEVGIGALEIMGFVLDYICGNHILWGATKVVHVKAAHTSELNLRKGLDRGIRELAEFAEASTQADEAGLKAMLRNVPVAASEDDAQGKAQDFVTRLIRNAPRGERAKLAPLSGKLVKAGVSIAARRAGVAIKGYEEVEADERYGAEPYSAWALISGLTEASQQLPSMRARTQADVAVGALASLVVAA